MLHDVILHLNRKSEDDVASADMMEDDQSAATMERPTSKEAIVALFRSDLTASAHVWIIVDDDERSTIVWNCVSSSTGKIVMNKFCSTTFFKNPVDGRAAECVNCTLFRQVGMDSGSSSPTCPHVCLREDVVRALSTPKAADDEFTKYLRRKFLESTEVNVVRKSENRLTLLVIADADKCRKKNVQRLDSLVTFQRSGTDAVLFCSNVECKRKKMSGKLKSPKDFCPHFDKVWSTATMVQLIYNVIGIPVGCEAWGLGTGVEFETDDMYPSDAMFTSACLLSKSENKDAVNVKYDVGRFRYIPRSGNVSPIPVEPTADLDKWSERRKLGVHVQRDAEGSLQWTASGFLLGSTLCDIDVGNGICASCKIGVITRQRIKDFKLYTSIGCVLRQQYIGICGNSGK